MVFSLENGLLSWLFGLRILWIRRIFEKSIFCSQEVIGTVIQALAELPELNQ
jgi:hypothetical protein